jgi:hypothetical protein
MARNDILAKLIVNQLVNSVLLFLRRGDYTLRALQSILTTDQHGADPRSKFIAELPVLSIQYESNFREHKMLCLLEQGILES